MEVRYQIQPKQIDDNDNELDLTQFTIQCDYTKKAMNYEPLPNADKWVELDYNGIITGCFFCFKSDQPVSLAATVSGVTTQIAVNAYNLIIRAEYTAPFYIKNTSGATANIEWAYYGD